MTSSTSDTPVTIVRHVPNRVWIETDPQGSRHVVIQSAEPGTVAHRFCTLRYDRQYTSNASLEEMAERIAVGMGATSPVERRFSEEVDRQDLRDDIRRLPPQTPRVENGALQFGDDWPGVFVRGDSAGYYAMTLHALLEPTHENGGGTEAMARLQLRGLYQLLRGAIVGPARDCLPGLD